MGITGIKKVTISEMKILLLGVGNILFGDEGIGVHLAHKINESYTFSGEHDVAVVDGGTLAQSLIPIITEYDYVVILDTIHADDAEIGDVYFFDFLDVPPKITWQGSAHEVEMLQTLTMIQLIGDLPATKVCGVMPYVIGEDTTFTISDPVLKAADLMEKTVMKHIEELGVTVQKTAELDLQEVAKTSFKK